MTDIVSSPPKFSNRQYLVRDKTGSLDPTKYLNDLGTWGTKLAAAINLQNTTKTYGKPFTVEQVDPVVNITSTMTHEELTQAFCYLVKCLQDASILAKGNGSN